MLEEKNIQSKKYKLGQFFTPVDLVEELIDNLIIDADIYIEPSFGGCGFIEPLVKKYGNERVVGIELDKEWFDKGKQQFPSVILHHKNFYDIGKELIFDTKKVAFVGNVPFRSPAYSLTTHKNYVKSLASKYGVSGIREEAVFFIIKTADILIENQYQGEIHYIIPKSLITNDSKFFIKFKNFLKKYFTIISVTDVDPSRFKNVGQGLTFLSMKIGGDQSNYKILHNNQHEFINEVFHLDTSDIPFQAIFKKTYLGSIPAESFLVSVSEESKEEFRDRLVRLINEEQNVTSLKENLQHKGKFHLKILSSKDNQKVASKLNQIITYINNVRSTVKDLSIFNDLNNYFLINHRKETRFYFRHKDLKRCEFVYELNPNPGPSFFFTSNPSAGSTDYYGYCEFDITRNSSPGCCRTIPLADISNNLTDDFKDYWNNQTNGLPFEFVFQYITHIYKSEWYKRQKDIRKRFYFCLPNTFDYSWLNEFDKQKQELEINVIQNLCKRISATDPIPPIHIKNTKVNNNSTFDDLFLVME